LANQLSDKAKKLIDGKNFAAVATIMPDGSPQITPVWVDREGDIVLLNATETRQKSRNLKRDPRVALAVFDMSNPYSRVVIRGRASELTQKGAEEHIDKMNMKYQGNPLFPEHDPKDPRVIIKILPERESD
jgi:PPOX class probable F420-dependent enzyme